MVSYIEEFIFELDSLGDWHQELDTYHVTVLKFRQRVFVLKLIV